MPQTDFPAPPAPAPVTRDLKLPDRPNPLTMVESFKQYFFADNLKQAEHKVLSMLPFFPESDGKRKAEVCETEIKPNVFINDFHITNVVPPEHETSSSRTLVMLHGWGTGMGLWFENLDAISSLPGWNIHVLDNPGMGRSTRETFDIVQQKDDTDGRKMVAEAEEWLVSRLEAWREKKGLERFVLLGHSLGGYLATVYAMRYPERIERLVLVSPVGVEHVAGVSCAGHKHTESEPSSESKPESEPLPEATSSSLGSQPTGPTSETQEGPHPAREFEIQDYDDIPDDIFASLKPVISENQIEVHTGADLEKRRQQNKVLAYMWQSHYSFIGSIRFAGPMGPKLVARWSYIRFQKLPAEKRDMMHIYVYRIFAEKSSGERALTRLMEPFCIARVPLIDRVSQIKCPSFWIYGETDWMNSSAGHDAAKRLNKLGRPAHYKIVADAGHHIYLDNPEAFNKSLLSYLKDAEEE